MNTRIIAITACLGAASTAAAQPIWYSLLTWQASLDGGETWQGGAVEVGDPFARVRVRAVVDWEYPWGYAPALAQFDETVATQGTIGLGDRAEDLERLSPFDRGFVPALASMRFGNVLKIDEATDTHPPGIGQGRDLCGDL